MRHRQSPPGRPHDVGLADARIRVLHSTRAAEHGVTKYATHMAATGGNEVSPVFFTWRIALFGHYDIFHLHWPEGLTGTTSGLKGTLSYSLTRLLLLRLRLTRIPVVHTLHNHTPHDSGVSRRLQRIYDGFDRLVVEEIHLVPEPGRVTHARTMYIPHGGYEEAFAPHPRQDTVPGRMVFFGIMRPYKGIEELLRSFGESVGRDRTLRLVGQPQDQALRHAVEQAADDDDRVSFRFDFLPDSDLVAEVTAAQLVVLPYRELHSSGAVLVALSLGRPVLIPDGPTAQALRDEVGAEWVSIYEGPLDGSTLETALTRSRRRSSFPPDLTARSWERVRRAHMRVYRMALASGRGNVQREVVFAWLWGQDDNVGDSALRRGYADALRLRGPLVVYVAGASAAYVSGLGLRAGDRTVSRLHDWLAEAVAAARQGPATIAINSGEFSFSGTYTVDLLRILPLIRRFRRLGGRVVWLGAAVPATRQGVTWLFRRLYDAADLVRWRDDETTEVFAPAPSMPDWALGLKTVGTRRPRTVLGVSLRSDRPYPTDKWIAAVQAAATRLQLDVVTVAQVQRDSLRAERLAKDLGGRAVTFTPQTPHDEQEGILRHEYGGMRAVISDRLHVLLLAHSEGAVPLGWTETATSKLARHFDSLRMPWVATHPEQCVARIAALDEAELSQLSATSRERLNAARAALTEVRATLAGDAWRQPPE